MGLLERLTRFTNSNKTGNPPGILTLGRRRVVRLPKDLSDRLDSLTTLNREVNGVLMYVVSGSNPFEHAYLIRQAYVTGTGTPDYAIPSPVSAAILIEFLKNHPEYSFAHFHTYTAGTIRRYGKVCATSFSPGDLKSYGTQANDDPEFIGMLITPQVKLLYGKGNLHLRIVTPMPLLREELDKEMSSVANKLGYAFQQLQIPTV